MEHSETPLTLIHGKNKKWLSLNGFHAIKMIDSRLESDAQR